MRVPLSSGCHLSLLLAVSLPALACKTSTKRSAVKDVNAGGISRPCIVETALRDDGYDQLMPAEESRVTRQIFTGTGFVEDQQKTVAPNANEVNLTMGRISAYIDDINNRASEGDSSRRVEIYRNTGGTPEPYCLFHKPLEPIYGTVILFHGFNDRPQQQAALASYLFHSGFNVYNAFLVNHWRVPGTAFWPKTAYRLDVLERVKTELEKPENAAAIAVLKNHLESPNTSPEHAQPGTLDEEDTGILDQILAPAGLSSSDIKDAWTDPGGPSFRKLFNFDNGNLNSPTPDFLTFITDAQARLDDLKAMPGPVFISGLSVGGAVVLGLAEAEVAANPDPRNRRIRGVISQAGWLKSISDDTQSQVMLVGPLDDKVTAAGGSYPISWPNHKVEFSPASIAATAALGSYVTREQRVAALATVRTAFITTNVEVSADNKAVKKLFDAMNAGIPNYHQYVEYPAGHNVGHAMTDPENYRGEEAAGSGGNHWNVYWRTLYQEIFRFYTTGKIDQRQLFSKEQDNALPRVACKIPGEFAYRCGM